MLRLIALLVLVLSVLGCVAGSPFLPAEAIGVIPRVPGSAWSPPRTTSELKGSEAILISYHSQGCFHNDRMLLRIDGHAPRLVMESDPNTEEFVRHITLSDNQATRLDALLSRGHLPRTKEWESIESLTITMDVYWLKNGLPVGTARYETDYPLELWRIMAEVLHDSRQFYQAKGR